MSNLIIQKKMILTRVFFFIFIIFIISQNLYAQNNQWKLIDSIPGIFYKSIENTKDFSKIVCIGGEHNNFQIIRISTDKGKTWLNIIDTAEIMIDSLSNDFKIKHLPVKLFDISITDEDIIYIGCDSGRIKISNDLGKTWKIISTTFSNDDIKYIKFNDSGMGLIAMNDKLALTNDTGKTWITRSYPDDGIFLSLTSFDFENIALIISNPKDNYFAHYYMSNDTGKSWFEVKLELVRGFSYINKKTILAVANYFDGRNTRGVRSKIYKSVDGGTHWEIKMDTVLDRSTGIIHIKLKNENYGVAFGDYESVWQTTDGGETWYLLLDHYIRKPSFSVSIIRDIAFLKDDGLVGVTYNTFKLYIYQPNDLSVVDGTFLNNSLNLYPNPAGEYIDITYPSEGFKPSEGSVQIFNILGECVFSTRSVYLDTPQESGTHPFIPSKEGKIRLDVSALPPGIYFVRLGYWVGKFVKI